MFSLKDEDFFLSSGEEDAALAPPQLPPQPVPGPAPQQAPLPLNLDEEGEEDGYLGDDEGDDWVFFCFKISIVYIVELLFK